MSILFRKYFFYLALLLPVFSEVGAGKVGNIERLTANADLWESSFQQVEDKFPGFEWEASGEKDVVAFVGAGMKFWERGVSRVELELGADDQLVKSLRMELLNAEATSGMSGGDLREAVKTWSALISKKLNKTSKQMPSIQVNNEEFKRVAWAGKRSTVVLSVASGAAGKRLVLFCHERDYGLARLSLRGKQKNTLTGGGLAGKSGGRMKTDKLDTPNRVAPRRDMKGRMSMARTGLIRENYGIKDNFDAPWPKLVKMETPEITVIKESEEEKTFIYHSPNYEFICDVKISKNVIKNFSTLFEATRLYCQQIPLSMVRAHLPDELVKFKILLFGTKSAYFQNGGPQGSAGVYMSGRGVIMIPLSSLGVKKVGSRFMFDYKVSNKTLPHEIAHQLTNIEYFRSGSVGWFSEGLAEYIGATAYRSGKFMVNGNLKDIKDYVTKGSRKDGRGRYLGEKIQAPDIKQYMLMSYSDFTSKANFNYGLGALITYYFLHMENNGDRKNINAFLSALNEGKRGEEALYVLLAGRSYDELEKSISKEWRKRGVRITFN